MLPHISIIDLEFDLGRYPLLRKSQSMLTWTLEVLSRKQSPASPNAHDTKGTPWRLSWAVVMASIISIIDNFFLREKRIRISKIWVVARAVQIVEEIYSRNAQEKMTLFVVEEEGILQRHLQGLYPCLNPSHRPLRRQQVLQCFRRLRDLLSLSPWQIVSTKVLGFLTNGQW